VIPISEELLEEIERGNVLLFVGEYIVRDASGQAVLDQLTAQLAAHCGITDAKDLTFPEAAQAYEDDKNRQALVQFMLDQLETLGDEPQQAHRLIAGLTDCNVLATTCLDQRLERAFEERGRPLGVIVRNEDVAFVDERKAQLYKLRGSVKQAELLVLTSDQYEAFEHQTGTSVMLLVLQGYLARKTIVFVGYDLADPHFQRLYRKTIDPLDKYARRAYALFAEPPLPGVSRWCKRRGIAVIQADTIAFLETLIAQLAVRAFLAFLKTLIAQLAARPQPAPAVPLRPFKPLPKPPYKLLDYYETKDADIFFGRQREALELTSLIHAHRLVLLYGASGVGKTSLLLAGTVPRLERAEPPYETIYVRALEDPAAVVRRVVRRRLPEADLPKDGSLVDFLAAATKTLDRMLVIIFDQFEEFFIRLSPKSRAAFITELGRLYDDRDVPVKVILSLREDWLASVSEIEKRIPEVFRTRMRLLPLTRDQAHQAITVPVEQLKVSYEPDLIERLLDDLAGEGVMPPQLQLVCSKLYDARGTSKSLTLKMYEELGQARGVLQAYLADELSALGRDQALAHRLLEELITSQGTKAVRTADDLARALQVGEDILTPLLERLVTRRLLRPIEMMDQDKAYELAHEYLISEIVLSPEVRARKEAEELLRQSMDNRQRHDTLMSTDHLQFVAPHVGKLTLGVEVWDLLLHSALATNHDVTFWTTQHSDPRKAADEVLSVLMKADLKKKKVLVINIAEELGREGNERAVWYPPLVEKLRDNLASTDKAVQIRAREILACMGPVRGLSWGARLRIYLAGLGFLVLVPQYITRVLRFGFGAALGGLLSGMILVPLGFWLDFLYQLEDLTLVQSVARWLFILGPSTGLSSMLIGLGLGLGVVLGRGRSLFVETTSSMIFGLVGGALVMVYLYVFFPAFVPGMRADIAIPLFAFLTAFIAGLIVYCARRVKRLIKRSQVISQIIAGAAVGAAIGALGDIIVGEFPVLFITGTIFGTGTAAGLSLAEPRVHSASLELLGR
jgi:hypothetical protein